jgi:hypothetical protein
MLRKRAVESLVRRLQSTHRVSWDALAELVGVERPTFMRKLEAGNIGICDLVLLEGVLPGLLSALADACGRRVVAPADSLEEGLAELDMQVAELAVAQARALRDGAITPAERSQIEKESSDVEVARLKHAERLKS